MATKKRKTNKADYNNLLPKLLKAAWIAVVSGFILAAAVFVMISTTMMPDTDELENPQFEVSSIIYDDSNDGKVEEIGRYFKLNRDWLTYDDLNPHLVNALVATEDERFFDHSGIDVRGTLRAVAFMGSRGGASTITQQLAKQFFTKRSRSFVKRVWQKLKEWVIAVEFEKRYTKEEIIAMYFNKFDFWYNANGIGAASRTYFSKEQQHLDIEEAAVLVAMFKNPNIYNPKKNPETTFKRRNVVLKQMVKNDFLDEDTYNQLITQEIDMSGFQRKTNYDGPAPYFRAELTKWLKELFNDSKYRKPDGTKYDIYTDGIKIYTTLDLPMQKHAESAMSEHMSNVQSNYFNHWKGMDPWTYKADEDEKSTRRASLNRKVVESERYQNLKSAYLSGVTSKIISSIPEARFQDHDIKRMLREETSPGHLANVVNKRWATKDQVKVYKKIMKSETWPEFKSQYKKLQDAVKKAFNTKVKTKVFAYNDAGYKMMNMTPMDSIKYHTQHMQFGSVSLDPKTGYVKTWVGGIGHEYYKYDHIQQSNRQIGSTFKPFLYTTVIRNGMSPCQKVEDIQYEIPAGDPDFGLLETWRPKNSRDFSGERVTLKEGLKQSLNSISIYLVKYLGNVEPIRELVDDMGINKDKVPSAPSICLGTPDLSVMDMAGAYTVFANNGIYSEPIFVKKIEDKNGRTIYNFMPEQKKVLSPKYNHVMVDMLKYVVQHRAGQFKSEIAGKTGTTNDHVDGWFMGITPGLVTATWVGGQERWIRFRSLSLGQGAVMARPYFEKFLGKIESDPSIEYDETLRFQIPEGEIPVLDCEMYDLLAQSLEKGEEKKKRDEFEEEFE